MVLIVAGITEDNVSDLFHGSNVKFKLELDPLFKVKPVKK